MKRIVLVASLAACAADDEVLEPGFVQYGDAPMMIEVPARGIAGNEIAIAIVTYGGGCVEVAETRVERIERGVRVTPIDRRHIPGPNEGCTLILKYLEHVAVTSFERAGTFDVIIRGRRHDRNGGDPIDELVDVPFSITIH